MLQCIRKCISCCVCSSPPDGATCFSGASQVTKKTADQVDAPSRDGAYVSGLLLEGASWWVEGGKAS